MKLDIESVLVKTYKKTKDGILKHSLESHLQSYTGDHHDMWAEPEFTGKYIDVCTKYYKNTGNSEYLNRAKAVINKSNAFITENHGALVCSVTTIADAVDYMEMYEAMAKSIVVSKIIGETNLLTKEDVADLNNVSKTRNLAIPSGDGTKDLLDVYNLK